MDNGNEQEQKALRMVGGSPQERGVYSISGRKLISVLDTQSSFPNPGTVSDMTHPNNTIP
jgi:hypothetical protein